MPNLSSLPSRLPHEAPLPEDPLQRADAVQESPVVSPPETIEQIEQESAAPSIRPETPPEPSHTTPAPRPSSTVSVSADNEEMHQIESILSEGLESEYQALSPALQARFRQEGERIAMAIQTILHHSKQAARQILDLIRHWLGLIPGVNKFFLEQEAKIKTDRLLELTQKSDHTNHS